MFEKFNMVSTGIGNFGNFGRSQEFEKVVMKFKNS